MNATANDKWSVQPYTAKDAAMIKLALETTGITAEALRKVFPKRPADHQEAGKVWSWIMEQGKAASALPTPAPTQAAQFEAKATDGYYAIPAGVLGFEKPHFFRLKHGSPKGRWANTQFVTEQASDEHYSVRGARKAQITAYLAEHGDKCRALYGTLISRCSRCNRTLTDHDNPYFPMYGPECGGK